MFTAGNLILGSIAGLIVGATAVSVPVLVLGRGQQATNSGGPTAPPVPSTLAAARAEYQRALSAVRATSGFHYVATSTGPANQRIVGDAGQSSGRQDITVRSNFGAEEFTLLLLSGTVYFEGNVPALQDQLGVSAANALALASRWVSVSNGDGPYSVLQPGITVGDQAGEMALIPSTVTDAGAGKRRIEGSVPPQQGAPAGSGHIDVDSGNHRPVVYVSVISANGVSLTSSTTFSKWDEAPSVTAPSGAVAWSTLGAIAPPGGYGGGGGGGGGVTPSPTPQGTL